VLRGALVALGALWVAPAVAQLRDGATITTSRYTIDLYQGPVLAGTRVIGLGGAFVAIGEGVDGNSQNPAAPAVRTPESNSHIDYDLGFGLTFPATLKNSDFFNSGRRTNLASTSQTPTNSIFDQARATLSLSGFAFLNAEANAQIGRWGFGLTADLQEYSLSRTTSDRLLAQIAVIHAQLAHAFADHQLMVGIGTRSVTMSVQNQNVSDAQQRTLFSTTGAGFETGFLWRPNEQHFRIGGAFRTAVTSRAADGAAPILYQDDPDNQLYLPQEVSLPWDLNLGFAVQLGPRPFNPRWVDPEDELARLKRFLRWRELERERRRRFELARTELEQGDVQAAARALDVELSTEALLDEGTLERAELRLDQETLRKNLAQARFRMLVTTSLVITGMVPDAVGVESFLDRTVQRSGQRISLSPRIGVETETVPGWLTLRSGSYVEPSRFLSGNEGARVHLTLGLDQRLFPWRVFGLWPEGNIWRASGSLDAARNYFGWGVAIGVWH
jgi:hypothetical protein